MQGFEDATRQDGSHGERKMVVPGIESSLVRGSDQEERMEQGVGMVAYSLEQCASERPGGIW